VEGRDGRRILQDLQGQNRLFTDLPFGVIEGFQASLQNSGKGVLHPQLAHGIGSIVRIRGMEGLFSSGLDRGSPSFFGISIFPSGSRAQARAL